VTKPRLLLTREEGVIVAKRYWLVDSGDEISIAALCDDGSNEFFVEKAHPTYREYYGVEVPDDAGYEKRRQAVSEATGGKYEDWIETDENGDVVPETEKDERLTAWLNSKVDAYHLDYWDGRSGRVASQYAPGFRLMWSLSEKDISRLGMREGDLGGPASSVPCVVCEVSLEELNRMIEKNDLPFILVDDEGSQEG